MWEGAQVQGGTGDGVRSARGLRLALSAAIAALAAIGALTWLAVSWFPREPEPLPVLGQLPDFNLVDAFGRPVTADQLAGAPWIANFIFTRCPDFCPALSARMARLQEAIRARKISGRLVSLSVDPTYDSPEVLRAYAARHGADRSLWLFLTGDRDSVLTLVRDGFRLPVEEAGDGVIAHSDRFVLVDAAGRIRGYYDSNDPRALDELLADLRRLDGAG